MKKVLLSLAVVSLISFTACKDDKKATENQETTDSTAQGEQAAQGEEAAPAEAAASDAPKFADADVQKFADDYATYVKDLTAAYKSKDATKIAELSQKAQEWATKSTEINKKIASNPEDAKKFSDYVQKLTQEMTSAMTAQ